MDQKKKRIIAVCSDDKEYAWAGSYPLEEAEAASTNGGEPGRDQAGSGERLDRMEENLAHRNTFTAYPICISHNVHHFIST